MHLLAGEHRGQLTHLRTLNALDEFELEVESDTEAGEEDDEEQEELAGQVRQNRVLVVNRAISSVGPLDIDRVSRKIVESSSEALRIQAYEDNGDGLQCPICEAKETPRKRLFQFSRLGAPFLIGGILPTLLA